jgi:acyl carrier protein
VRESLVLVREDVPGEKRLVAYLTARPGMTLEEGTLAEHLRSRLPDYMIPSAWVLLPEFPLTHNGKIDRDALPDPAEGTERDGEGENPPETPTEKAVAQIWARLLPGRTVDRKMNFFEQGGHSLLAMQLVSRIHQAFRVELPLAALFENPTISSLALLIEEKLTEEIEKSDDEGPATGGGTP